MTCKNCPNERLKGRRVCYSCLMAHEAKKKLERKPRKKKSDRQKIKDRLDKLCSEIVRRDPCARCGTRERLTCSHIYSRRHLSVRWSLLNLKCLCLGCHQWFGKNPIEAYDWIVESGIRTKEQMAELKKRKESVKKWTDSELEELEKELKPMLDPSP